mmetsp:Transcript_29426/g.44901  ORF Transcript_29426/g.44901 Transcript_29426/m.44901 type:complete len:354 (+) Transcript_29426:42-1103(+)
MFGGKSQVLHLILLITTVYALSQSSTDTTLTRVSNAWQSFDYQTSSKLPWIPEGYQTWKWLDHEINYIEVGDKSKPALVLIHGFGASSYHWRNNILDLARDYHVFAFCKLGLGLSDKPVQDYSAEVWRDQTVGFLKEVVKKPATLAGNSIGGFTSLYTAATDEVKHLVEGVILLNGAGRFRDSSAPTTTATNDEESPDNNGMIDSIKGAISRFIVRISFFFTKQPARIEQILRQVYPVNEKNVDPELVESIRFPSLDENAAEVFYRIISRTANGQGVFIDDLLEKMECPLLLCWGEYDPWIRPAAADRVQALYRNSKRVNIQAGHCPHDEAPEAVNEAIREFMETSIIGRQQK